MADDLELFDESLQKAWDEEYPYYNPWALTQPGNLAKAEVAVFTLQKASVHPLDVNFRTNKLRQLRDYFDQHGLVSVSETALPAEIRSKLMGLRVPRDYHGNFSRDGIQTVIQAQPNLQYNWSTGTFDRAVGATQRHSNELSNVLRLEITPDQERRMREAGVWDAWNRMQQSSVASGHPVNERTAGWARWTGDKSGVHLDELQSDFGRPWPGLLAETARKQYAIPEADIPAWVAQYASQYPEDQRKIIQKILFGNKHPGEAIQEAFHSWARGPGELAGAPVHIWQPEAKLHIANIDADPRGHFDQRRPIPGHMQVTYRDVPVGRGMEEGKYGEIPTQSNPKLKRMPPKQKQDGGEPIIWQPSNRTYKDVVRKNLADTLKNVIEKLK